ncbi:hypothetical protein [Nonomuraea sp. NPDC003709]|uniref:hypothetical protein n=1 Tax=Nonomuraea sp. NPDC003709 TaxID=3154450 RepID=UPI0033A17FA1
MDEPRTIPLRPRDRLYAVVTLVLAVLLLPAAFLRRPGQAREEVRRRGRPPRRRPHPGVGYDIENGSS